METTDAPYLSVIIPCYNEARRLPATLIDIDRYLSQTSFAYEILVVDDGSSDTTANIVEAMQSAIANLRVLRDVVNRGKGAAVRRGMLEARGTIRLFTDADNATSMDEFAKLQPYFEEGYEVVFASRAMPDSILDPPQPWYRQLAGRIGNLLFVRLINLPNVHDSQCGFKAFTARAAHDIFGRAKIDRFGFDIEALALARALKLRSKEVGVLWRDKPGSVFLTFGLRGYLQIWWENLRIRLYLMKGSYGLSRPVPDTETA
jgi:glycosyltransferase involved in cell wall biosynthesis